MAGLLRSIDHVVLSTRDERACIEFYTRVLGMELERYGGDRIALRFGDHKLNVHQPGLHAKLVADRPTPGSLDLCFVAAVPLDVFVQHLHGLSVPILEGPVFRTGARGRIRSVYLRDPDGNLVEISEPAG